MPTSWRDTRYGRGGGHWIDGDGAEPPPPELCSVCDKPLHAGQTGTHVVCAQVLPDVGALDFGEPSS